MKKVIYYIISLIIFIVLLVIVDLLFILENGKPLFSVEKENGVYYGLFYDTYNCAEFSIPQIKSKGTKFSCIVESNSVVIDIVDKTKNIKDFACAEMLESFYEDDEYIYFWNCLKNKYMIVKYDNGYEETISNALKNERISIDDLDSYDISYIKEEKEKVFIETSVDKNCDKKAKLYYSDSNVNVYTYCLNSVNVTINDKAYNLSDYFKLGGTIHSNMDFIVNKLIDSEFFKDALIYKDGGSRQYSNSEISILMCNTVSGNRDVYIGVSDMGYDTTFCK